MGKHEAAAHSYREAVRLRPDHAPSLNDLGLVLQEQGKGEAAAQCFQEALRCDPQCADAHYNLGCLLLLDNRLEEARACHGRAIAAAPLHGPALWARCMVELPILYQKPGQISRQRARYTQQLEALAARADNPAVAGPLERAALRERMARGGTMSWPIRPPSVNWSACSCKLSSKPRP